MSIECTLHSFAYALDYVRDQVADLSDHAMVSQPEGIANHPAWVIGHLTFSCQALGGEVGLSTWLPESYAQLFGTGSVPVADGSLYPKKDESLVTLRDSQNRIADAVRRLSDAQLDVPLPDEKYRVILPTIRHAVTQVLVAHTANHVGQLSVWRRAMGLPVISRPFA